MMLSGKVKLVRRKQSRTEAGDHEEEVKVIRASLPAEYLSFCYLDDVGTRYQTIQQWWRKIFRYSASLHRFLAVYMELRPTVTRKRRGG